MSFRLELRPQVDLDIANASEEILRDPLLPRIRDRARQIRWVLPRRFPYRIVFGVVQETVTVYAVVHAVRHDRHWKRRV